MPPWTVKKIDIMRCGGDILPFDTIRKCMRHPSIKKALALFNSNLTRPIALSTFMRKMIASLCVLRHAQLARLYPLAGPFLDLSPSSVDALRDAILCAPHSGLTVLLEDNRHLLHKTTDLAYFQLRVLCTLTPHEFQRTTTDEANDDPRKCKGGWIRRPRDRTEIARDQAVARRRACVRALST